MDAKKELANSTANATGVIVKTGEDFVKKQLLDSVIPSAFAANHRNRTVHIHDLEFYSITYNCIGIRAGDLIGSEKRSFPAALRALGREIIWLTNIQSGGIGFLDFDSDMACFIDGTSDETALDALQEFFCDLNAFTRKGCEKPYVTFNFGLCTSSEGRRVSTLILNAYMRGDKNGQPFIFPNLVLKLKSSINVSKDSPNHDIYLQAVASTASRMVPTYYNCDSPANKDAPADKIGIMGCRTRVVSNLYGDASGLNRGNIACVTINLVQMAFGAEGKLDKMMGNILSSMEQSKDLLLHRFGTLVDNADFSLLRTKKVYKDSDKGNRDMLRNGTLSIGFIGLWDALSVQHGKEWHDTTEMEAYKDEALSIIEFMRKQTDRFTDETKMNFSLLASAAEGVSGSFAEYDSLHAGKGRSECEKGYYTNSFHIPVFIKTDYMTKVDFEAPFHRLCNGGSITYIELEEMPWRNTEAVQEIIEYAYTAGCNYIGINFPLDNCMDCDHIGRIAGTCPKCGSTRIRRLRRVSGYLAEEDRFTSGKHHEMQERTAHADLS